MQKKNQEYRYSLLSPLDSRYYFSNTALFESLSEYLSEEATIKYHIKVEMYYLREIAKQLRIPLSIVKKAEKASQTIRAEEVYTEERKTIHHIRALVNIIKKKVPTELKQFVHLGATSYDIIETSTALRITGLSNTVLIPLLIEVLDILVTHASNELHTVQVGRTHGQFSVPITVGHFFCEYISRLGQSIESLNALIKKVPGKISGAVGGYNALSLFIKNPLEFERDILANLNLPVSEYSKQICSPETLLRVLLEYNIIFGIFANLADDLRNLQRSEIAEFQEFFDAKQVGSSTMPQKKNPWNSEHIKSLYKAFSPRVMTFFMDQISEHQRDLSNSASSRFIAEYLSGFAAATQRCLSVLTYIKINRNQMLENIQKAGDNIYAEAVYILLSLEGHNDAHELTRKIFTQHSQHNSAIISTIIEKKYPKLWKDIAKQLKILHIQNPHDFFKNAKYYTGCCAQRSTTIIKKYKRFISKNKIKS